MSSLKQIVEKFVSYYNDQKLENLMELYDDEAINDQTALKPIHGKEAIRKMLQGQFSRMKAYCIIQNMIEQDNFVCMEWTDPTGFRGCTIFFFKENKISIQKGYWDKITYCKYHNLEIPKE